MQAAFKKHAVSLTKHFFQMQVIAAAQPHHTRQTDPNCNFGFSVLLWCSHALGKCGLFEIVETTMQSFRAFYEDAAKTEAAARKLGYNGTDGSLMDFVEPSDYRTGKSFPTLAQAEQWLKTEIDAMKTVFGCGTIRVQEPVNRRCRYCVCGGVRNLHEYTVDDTGIVEDEVLEDQCLN